MADRAPGVRFDHVGLSVDDLAATAAWYGAVFGFEPEVVLRVDALALDIIMLIQPERGDRLELLHRPGSVRPSKPANPGEAALDQRFGHIAFCVSDLDDTYRRVVAAGARAVMAPQASPEPGVRMAFVADLEGNLVELLQR